MMFTDDLINKLIEECFDTEQEIIDYTVLIEDHSTNKVMVELAREYLLVLEARIKYLHGHIGFLILEEARKSGH